MDRDRLSPRIAGLGLLGALAVAIAALILLWPGPFEPSDSLPFALVFGIPGAVSLLHARWLYRSG